MNPLNNIDEALQHAKALVVFLERLKKVVGGDITKGVDWDKPWDPYPPSSLDCLKAPDWMRPDPPWDLYDHLDDPVLTRETPKKMYIIAEEISWPGKPTGFKMVYGPYATPGDCIRLPGKENWCVMAWPDDGESSPLYKWIGDEWKKLLEGFK